ncbi:MAG: hypothetical protein ACOYL5_16535, partial [Phototrophicaceae bacterium]
FSETLIEWLRQAWLSFWNSPFILVVRQFFGFILGLIGRLLTGIANMVAAIFRWIGQLLTLYRLASLWQQSSPTPIPGVTACSAYLSNPNELPPFCVGLWVMNETFWQDNSLGDYFLKLISTVGALYVAWMVISDIYSWIQMAIHSFGGDDADMA